MHMQDIDAEIIIVGSGISGLTAAFTLLEKEPTLSVLILEKSGRSGGRVLSVPLRVGRNTFSTFDLGAGYLLEDQTELLKLLKKTGVTVKSLDRPSGNVIFKLSKKKIIVKEGETIFSKLSSADRLQFARFIVNIETLCKNVINTTNYKTVGELCNQSLEEYIANIVESNDVRLIINHVVLTNIGMPLSKISMIFYIFFCISHNGIENQLSCLRDKQNYLNIMTGTHTLCENMLKSIGRYSLIKDEQVVSIKIYDHCIEVLTKNKLYLCYSIIMAISPKSALDISFQPPLPKEKLKAFSEINTGITISFVIIYPTCTGKYKKAILKKLCHYFGKECLNPISYQEHCWKDDFGKMCTWELGVLSYIDSVTKSTEKICWAGAETSTEWYGSVAGAVHSGIRAALQTLYDRRPSALTVADMDIIRPILKKRTLLREHNDPIYKSIVHWKYYSFLVATILFLILRLRKYIKQ